MSRLKELIDEFCPDGVEYKALSELFDIRNGYTPSKKNLAFWDGGTHPWFVMEDIRRDGTILKDSLAHITDAAIKKGLFPANSIIVATSATIGVHALVTVDFLCNQRFACMTIKKKYADILDIRYAYQAFFALDRWCLEHVDQGNFATVNSAALKMYRIPVPPIEIQREIVRILDSFQELDDALTAEIEAREKQIVSVADELILKSVPKTDWKPLNEVGQLQRGKRFTFAQMSETGDLGCIHYGDVYFLPTAVSEVKTFLNNDDVKSPRLALPGDVVFSCTSEITDTVGRAVAWLGSQPVAVHDDCQILHHDMDATYVSYFAQTRSFNKQKMKGVTRSKIARLSGEWLGKVRIPVPSMNRQHEIVEYLSSIETLVGQLRVERDARRKQFAYYRDKLLSFPEKVTTNG